MTPEKWRAAAVRLALKIAKSETRGLHYRDDVIGDALLAVAELSR